MQLPIDCLNLSSDPTVSVSADTDFAFFGSGKKIAPPALRSRICTRNGKPRINPEVENLWKRVERQMLLASKCLQWKCVLLLMFVTGTHQHRHQQQPQQIYPTPPIQYPSQVNAFQNMSSFAKSSSLRAHDSLLQVLASPSFRKQLQATCPQLLSLTGDVLLSRLRDEIAVMEMAHSFGGASDSLGEKNMLEHFLNATIFYNLWQEHFLGIGGISAGPENFVELNAFQLPEFYHNAGTPTYWEGASQRLIYTWLNLAKSPGAPNPGFGDLSIVFNRTYVAPYTIISPYDTGSFVTTCWSRRWPGTACAYGSYYHCCGWDGIVGTLDHLDHIILARNDLFWGPPFTNGTLFPQVRCNPVDGQVQVDLSKRLPIPLPSPSPRLLPSPPYPSWSVAGINISRLTS